MSERQALCCACGTLRTCRRVRNYRPENYWLRGPVDPDWHRETGDLKCDHCATVTRHAIITGSNLDERMTRIALGGHDPWANQRGERERIQAAYQRHTKALESGQ